jgi:hypothetical protein
MRYTCVTIDFGEDNLAYRYEDMKDPYNINATVDSVEDLEDGYFKWTRGKDFQWFVEASNYANDKNRYTIAFYENHPFFNCGIFLSDRYDEIPYEIRYAPFDAVEEWIEKVHYQW